jgi:hypothetical protein
MGSVEGSGAVCEPHHAPATLTCRRCGSFICGACLAPAGPEDTCSACTARMPHLDVPGLERIAVCQRHVLWALLANLAMIPVVALIPAGLRASASIDGHTGLESALGPTLIGLMYYALLVVRIVTLWRLCGALQMSKIWALVSPLGCLGLLALLVVNSKATERLKGAGVRVGLMGASVPLTFKPENAI